MPDTHPLEFSKKCPHGLKTYLSLKTEYGCSDTLVSEVIRHLVRNVGLPASNRAGKMERFADDTCCLIGMQRNTIHDLFGTPQHDEKKGSGAGEKIDVYFYYSWRPQGSPHNSAKYEKEILIKYNNSNEVQWVRYSEYTPWLLRSLKEWGDE